MLDPAPSSEGLYTPGTQAEVVATPAAGFAFDRWEGDFSSRDGYIAFVVIDSDSLHDQALTAYFVETGSCCSLLVTMATPASGTVTLSPTQPAEGYAVGDNVTLTAEATPGYLFSRWEGGLTATRLGLP